MSNPFVLSAKGMVNNKATKISYHLLPSDESDNEFLNKLALSSEA